MADGGIPRIVVRIDPDEYPELAAELAPLQDRSRAGRLRLLASMGILYLRAQQSGSLPLTVTVAGTTTPAVPSEVADTAAAPQTRVRRPTRAAGMMRGTSGPGKT